MITALDKAIDTFGLVSTTMDTFVAATIDSIETDTAFHTDHTWVEVHSRAWVATVADCTMAPTSHQWSACQLDPQCRREVPP